MSRLFRFIEAGKRVPVNTTGIFRFTLWVRAARGNEIYFALVSRQIAALGSVIQQAMPLEFGGKGERSVLTLGSLCLLCCVRDTA